MEFPSISVVMSSWHILKASDTAREKEREGERAIESLPAPMAFTHVRCCRVLHVKHELRGILLIRNALIPGEVITLWSIVRNKLSLSPPRHSLRLLPVKFQKLERVTGFTAYTRWTLGRGTGTFGCRT